MFFRILKGAAITVVCAGILGYGLLGDSLFYYIQTGTKHAQESVKQTIPVEIELQRARNLIRRIIPELQALVVSIAKDEVEVATLKNDIQQASAQLERDRLALAEQRESFSNLPVALNDTDARNHAAEQLASKLRRFKTAEVTLSGKRKLLESRERTLQTTIELLESTRTKKQELEQEVEALAAHHRLINVQSLNSNSQVNQTTLSQADQLLNDISRRLKVAERVLEHEADLFDEIDLPGHISTAALLADVESSLRVETNESVSAAESRDAK